MQAVADAALAEVRGIISHDALAGRIRLDQQIDVEDADRRIFHRLHFTDAVTIVGAR